MNTLNQIRSHLNSWGARTTSRDSRSRPNGVNDTVVEFGDAHSFAVPLRVIAGARAELTAPQWEAMKSRYPQGLIIGHDYVNPRQAERYRALGIPYVDVAGNAWLDFDGFKVWVQGQRPVSVAGEPTQTPRAFTRTGAKLVFVLLVRDDLVSAPLRTLAEAATISLGATQQAIKDLNNRGYLDAGPARTEIRRREDLITEWTGAFVNRLLPSLQARLTTGPAPTDWPKLLKPGKVDATIAGEANQTELIRPITTTIYGQPPWAELTQAGRLRPSNSDPNVILRERFWNEDVLQLGRTAPALLDYGELIASGDARQREVAAELRETKHV